MLWDGNQCLSVHCCCCRLVADNLPKYRGWIPWFHKHAALGWQWLDIFGNILRRPSLSNEALIIFFEACQSILCQGSFLWKLLSLWGHCGIKCCRLTAWWNVLKAWSLGWTPQKGLAFSKLMLNLQYRWLLQIKNLNFKLIARYVDGNFSSKYHDYLKTCKNILVNKMWKM